ncbi:MAG: SPOR domain-containing protein [Terracidiphilus sp.]
MRQYFGEDEKEAEQPRPDTEVTLGAGAVLGISVALLLVCALCFVWGYAVGHRSPAVPPAKAAASTAAPDQEPLQGNDTIPKPSAVETSPAPQADASSTAPVPGMPGSDSTNASAPGQAASGQVPGAAGGTASPQVQPALPAMANGAPPAQPGAPNTNAATPNQMHLMVQIAAVAHAEDAQVLVTALRKRGYPVNAIRDPADGLIHVRIGPFHSQDEAIRWRDKLLGDGYNAQIQQ